jgi:hypothetical protein
VLSAKFNNLKSMRRMYGPANDSEACHRYAALEPNRRAQMKQIVDAAPTEHLRSQSRRLLLVQRLVPSAMDQNMAFLTNPIVDALLSHFSARLQRDPRMILFGLTKECDVVAMQSSFDDYSSLVIASDALFSFCNHLTGLNELWVRYCHAMKDGFVDLDIDDFQQTSASAASLICVRYWVIQQRLFGLSGLLTLELSRDETDHAMFFARAAHTFIMAHEAAHYVLGHENKPHISLTNQALPVADDSQVCENEADELAIAVASIALEQVYGEAAPTMALAGAVIALAAVGVTERALFVRRARSHPPVSLRLDNVLRSVEDDLRRQTLSYTFGATIAAEYGEDFLHPLRSELWERGSTEPAIRSDHPTLEYRRLVAQLDQLHGTSVSAIADLMNEIPGAFGVDLRDSPTLIADGQLEELLTAWGVDDLEADVILDDNAPLLFFTLHSALADSARLAPIESEELRRYVATLTALFIHHACFPLPEFHT